MGLNLLSTETYKITKGNKVGVITGILHLVSSNHAFQHAKKLHYTDKLFKAIGQTKTAILALLKGKNLCPWASLGCTMACLLASGRGKMHSIRRGRLRKTIMFFQDRTTFISQLWADIKAIERKANREGKTPAIRLNGTSDVPWERIEPTLFSSFPDVRFYDYTKSEKRVRENQRANYHLTYSHSEKPDSLQVSLGLLADGFNVAMVFDVLPESYLGFRVINGDDTDVRFFDPTGVIVGLTPKGKAGRNDDSGFVIRTKAISV